MAAAAEQGSAQNSSKATTWHGIVLETLKRNEIRLTPYVPDKGIETVMKDLANRRPIPKEFIGRPELFRDNAPLEKALARS